MNTQVMYLNEEHYSVFNHAFAFIFHFLDSSINFLFCKASRHFHHPCGYRSNSHTFLSIQIKQGTDLIHELFVPDVQ